MFINSILPRFSLTMSLVRQGFDLLVSDCLFQESTSPKAQGLDPRTSMTFFELMDLIGHLRNMSAFEENWYP